ncbi:mechanosensitive ion channel domain-containing protein [Adhaeretor mobilis]|uniref:Small-conductance mechanosensitive channel n=1 Tax=Adhaeretor mobilis TaxID=1930276 RepID=A0A517N089_9BACT|nr:mechanosensitive ion channel domain-containing protein [Adhaeretor mobilis]QDT00549.1 Small-conductance mechanosensitive channel [Adhaeretor mobilis]
MQFQHGRSLLGFLLAVFLVAATPAWVNAQKDAPATAEEAIEKTEVEPKIADQVNVKPEAEDEDISTRLERILGASGLFSDVEVRVDEGIVFLTGSTKSEEARQKASDLANNTQDVVMTVNNIEIVKPSIWDFSAAEMQMKQLVRDVVQSVPTLLITLALLVLTWFAAKLMGSLASWFFGRRVENAILRRLLVQILVALVCIVGIYLVLRIAGLTRLATTVLGGTGLLGLIIGIAFRDIAENFLASLLISLQRPFLPGDRIEVDGNMGVVQSVTTRGTMIMTLDGNHVHIPNSTIYKNVVRNFTANPNSRLEFVVGIDFEDSVAEAQEVAVNAIREHPAVLDEPGPTVLVEELGASTVNLRMQFWVDTNEYEGPKVLSAVIRKVKAAYEKSGLTMPDEAREIIFPKSVPVRMLSEQSQAAEQSAASEKQAEVARRAEAEDDNVTSAEGGLHSDEEALKEQARHSRKMDAGTELLDENSSEEQGQGSGE